MATADAERGEGTPEAPVVPEGRHYHLVGRGSQFVRELPGPPGAPAVVLLHGWLASGALNWAHAFQPLARHFRVVAPDLRGHARGPRTWRRFRLEDCADDVAGLLRRLNTGPVLAVGYSMGGPVAQLLCRRHPADVAGLVLCATSDTMTAGRFQRLAFGAITAAVAGTTRAGQIPAALPRWMAGSVRRTGSTSAEDAAGDESQRSLAAGEMRRHDIRMLMEAGFALSRHDARPWIGTLDLPTAVVVTARDGAIPPRLQRGMAGRIPAARTFDLRESHTACAREGFARTLVRACQDVAERVEQRRQRRIRPRRPAAAPAPRA